MSLRCGDLNWESWAKQVDLDDLPWVFGCFFRGDEILSSFVGVQHPRNSTRQHLEMDRVSKLGISYFHLFSGSMFVLGGVLLNKP